MNKDVKKTFIKFWLKGLIISLAICSVIILICSFIFILLPNTEMKSETLVFANEIENNMKNQYRNMLEKGYTFEDEADMEKLISAYKWYLSRYLSLYGEIYYEGECIAESSPGGYAIVLEYEDSSDEFADYYYCNMDSLNELIEDDTAEFETISYIMEDMYIKGNSFIPKTIIYGRKAVEDDVRMVLDFETDTIINTVDYTDYIDIDLSDYDYVENNEDNQILGPIIITKDIACEKAKNYLHNSSEYGRIMDIVKNEDEGDYLISQSGFSGKHISVDRVELDSDHIMYLVTAQNFDVLYYYLGTYIAAAVIILVLGIVISFIIARFRYVKYVSRYNMEEYRTNLTNIMAHDLKTPLMAISGYAENLKTNVHTDKKEYYVDTIINNVDYMSNIINNVLELGAVENKSIKLDRESVNIKEMIQEILSNYEDNIAKADLRFDIDGELILECDIRLMSQAMDNLISNVIKYASEDTEVKIKLDKKHIAVSNKCTEEIAVAADELCKPFVKGDNSRSNSKGTGMGLAIVKNIIELHGYKLEVSYEEAFFTANIKL